MKNKFQLFTVLIILTAIGLGCRSTSRPEEAPAEPGSNKSLTDKAVDKTVGHSSIGVPECDAVMDEIEDELNNSEDNVWVKAAKATFLNRIKDSIRDSVKENKGDTVEMAKTCKEFKTQLDQFKAQERGEGQVISSARKKDDAAITTAASFPAFFTFRNG